MVIQQNSYVCSNIYGFYMKLGREVINKCLYVCAHMCCVWIEMMTMCHVTCENTLQKYCKYKAMSQWIHKDFTPIIIKPKSYTLNAIHVFPAKIKEPAWEPCKAEHSSVALIHELLPAVTSLLLHTNSFHP